MDELKDVLVVTVDMMLRPAEIARIRDSIHQQIKDGVVILPSYCDAKIVHCPENIEIRIESAAEPNLFD